MIAQTIHLQQHSQESESEIDRAKEKNYNYDFKRQQTFHLSPNKVLPVQNDDDTKDNSAASRNKDGKRVSRSTETM
jgi:hypothetical protein